MVSGFALVILMGYFVLSDVRRRKCPEKDSHAAIRMTEKHYAPWVKAREILFEEETANAMSKMGAIVSV